MADYDERHVALFLRSDTRHLLQVVNDTLEVTDQRAFAVGLSMPDVIRGVHGRTLRGERICDVRVPSAVFRVAVHDEDYPARSIGCIPHSVVDAALASRKGRFPHRSSASTDELYCGGGRLLEKGHLPLDRSSRVPHDMR